MHVTYNTILFFTDNSILVSSPFYWDEKVEADREKVNNPELHLKNKLSTYPKVSGRAGA